MKLLKIGRLGIPQNRWLDSLDSFERIYVLCYESEQVAVENERIKFIRFKDEVWYNSLLLRCIKKASRYKYTVILVQIGFTLLRLFNLSYLKKIRQVDYEYIHSSYNDFDESGILSILLKNVLKNKTFTRAFKETRPGYNYIEKYNFKMADRIILNEKENKQFFEEKYGRNIFTNKKVVIGLDEDYRSKASINNVVKAKKLSKIDGKIHIVILAGRVFSDDLNERSGGRLYYIPLIKQFLENDFIVHLHTLKMYKDSHGKNQYEVLRKLYPDKFYIHNALDFEHNAAEAYKELSKYDFGILHNFVKGSSVSDFDKINIPHRYYEYQIAEVIPILEKGKTIVMEKILRQRKTGLIYNNLDDIRLGLDIEFEKPTFEDYIKNLYEKMWFKNGKEK